MSLLASAVFLVLLQQAPLSVAELETKARAALTTELKDPLSAQFMDLREVPSGKGPDNVCGQVNAKNSYGAYGGFEPFLIAGDTGTVILVDKSAPALTNHFREFIVSMCRPRGMAETQEGQETGAAAAP